VNGYRRADVIARIDEALEESSRGVFLRLYIPNGRYQSDQLASFLRLFEKYLHQVEGKKFSIDTLKAAHGLTYTFRNAEGIMNFEDIDASVQRFDAFMNLCKNEPQKAEETLAQLGMSPIEALGVISRYTRDYQRIIIDTRHEMEHKKLILSQRLESEIFELVNSNFSNEGNIISPNTLLSLANNSGPIIINIPNISAQHNVFAEQVVNGDIVYTQNDKILIELFDKYADKLLSVQLKSSLEILKDDSSPEETRRTSKQKIIGFLSKVASKVGDGVIDVSAKVLVAYLDSLIKGTGP